MYSSGEGTVSCNTENIKVGNKVSYTVTPEKNWFIKEIRFNNVKQNVADLKGGEYITPPVTENSVLYVYFSKYEEKKPEIFATPYVFKTDDNLFFLGRLYNPDKNAEEFGVLISRTDREPDINSENTVKVKAKSPENSQGYFGFLLINKTDKFNIEVNIRPYVLYKNEYRLNDKITRVVLNDMTDIGNFTTYSQWLKNNNLDDVGFMQCIINKEGVVEY